VPHKYHAVRTGKYASKREAKRAQELAYMQKMEIISDLEEQVKFEIIPKNEDERAAHYIADFVFIDCSTGHQVVEDVKGFKTPEYKLKRKLMRHVYGIKISEVN
jgi:hypothetical protein